MKKKILGIALASGLVFLAGCSQTDPKRDVYVDALKKCESKFQVKEAENKLTSNVTMDLFMEGNASAQTNYNGTRAFVYFLSLIYENPNFKITDDAVKIECDYEKNGTVYQDNEMSILGAMDKENNKINFELYGKSVIMSEDNTLGNNNFYFIIEINYEFETSTLKDFDLYMYNTEGENLEKNSVFVYRYTNDTMYRSISESQNCEIFYEYASTNYWNSNKEKLLNASYIGDFKYEYTKSFDDIFGENVFKK